MVWGRTVLPSSLTGHGLLLTVFFFEHLCVSTLAFVPSAIILRHPLAKFSAPRSVHRRSIACGAVCARTFEFVGYGEEYTGSSPSICADGLVKGAR
eukprot:3869533-Rhodomonas_salina.2